ncbi:unnamed protein product [Brassicogethes aeneus]|uniref:Uncharacterized protein n=1 Tax=Brassicogethes aeneus TaxID=1431903 RepID=A0A9P0B0R0_BRAAE|nr:unnamed protein product [Brassicogethes aeneus]
MIIQRLCKLSVHKRYISLKQNTRPEDVEANNSLNISFTDKLCIITGSNSGIGFATANLFNQLGARLILIDKDVDFLKSWATNLDNVQIVKADLRCEDETLKALSCALKKDNCLDVLINAAGIIRFGGIFDSTREQIDALLSTTLKALHCITKWALPHLMPSQGNIVNVSGRFGLRPAKDMMAYSIAMSSIDQFTKCLALDLASCKVRANCVNPGTLESTGLYRNAGMSREQFESYKKHSLLAHPMGKLGNPGDVAKAIAFLASGHASYITGVSLPVDGGASIQNFP